MALKIYYKDSSELYVEVSSSSDLTSPVTTTHDGKNGDVQTVCLYLRNDDAALYYTNIEITPVDLVDPNPYGDVVYDETGWGVKLHEGSAEPTSAEWADVTWGRRVAMDDIGSSGSGDTTTYSPFWYLISCPPNTDAQNKTDIVLRVTYTENAV